MLLYYIASKNNQGLFDEICTQKGILIQRHTGQANLKKLIIEGMTNFSHISYFAVDLSAVKNTNDEILEAFTAFQSMYNARIILLTFSCDNNDRLLSSLVEAGIYNIVAPGEDIVHALCECMSELGRQYKAAVRRSQPEADAAGLTIKVGICGAQKRVGTTTQGILLAKTLGIFGEKACYVEANGQGHIKTLAGYYEVEENEKLKKIHFGDLDMFYDSSLLPTLLDMEYRFYIVDYGVIGMDNIQAFSANDMRIICAGAKTWEMANIIRAVRMLDKPDEVSFLFSFVPKSERKEIRSLMAEHTDRVYFAEYEGSLFSRDTGLVLCGEIFKDYLKKREVRVQTSNLKDKNPLFFTKIISFIQGNTETVKFSGKNN